jgi:4-hydroxy-tetrahydrodipicolinate synthase
MARTDLAWYSGEDALNLALLAVGASGMVSVVGHLVGDRLRDMAEALWSGDIVTAQKLNESMLPVFTGIFRSQGVILTKAALQLQGLPSGPVRLPLVNATDAEIDQLIQDLTEGGVALTHARP